MYGTRIPGLVELTAGPWAAALLPAFGMNTVALSFYGMPVLRTPPSLDALEENPSGYGTPLLLPYDSGWGGLPMGGGPPLQGELFRRPFTVMERKEHSVLALFENSGGDSPPFSVEARCILARSGFRQEFAVKNTGSGGLPLTFGLYTTFFEPPQFRVDVGRRMALNEQRFPTGECLPLQGEELSIPLGVRPQGRAIQGLYTAAGHTAQVGDILYRVSENFDRWLLWNGDGRQGFCTIGPLQGGGKPGTPLWLEPGGCIVFEAAFCYAENRAGGRPCTLYISNGSQRGGPGAPTGGKHYRRCPPPAGSRTYL